ncbi:ubiquitin carboxyl-terminal hydrolase CYLD-like isoform X2 [Amblyraja radiata]|uniref:ubiquitin carboxyl-terminal hydrolase CYLD-like isoform X2 n=1 Tax=Amblyraja radiata TaxID=386614 RepID=UPI001402F245|nr:ubiquitin carboxyl-terminal hydrolase CYLD-like isoform X2 [Amblyraja radiata]
MERMGGVENDKRYCIVLKDFTTCGIKVPRGSLGYFNRSRREEMSATVENVKQVVKLQPGNYILISKEEAELLVDIQDLSHRYELFKNEPLFRSIAKVQINDVVQLRKNNKELVGIVKNIENTTRKKELDLYGTLFQVSLMEDNRPSRKKCDPCVKVNAGEIIQVSNTEVEPFDRGKNSSKHISKALTQISPDPFEGCENPALEVGSMVEVQLRSNLAYGVIRWIGIPEGKVQRMAGIELDYEQKTGSDGTFEKRQYFVCEKNKALFIQLGDCKPDARFLTHELKNVRTTPINAPEKMIADHTMEEDVPPVREDEVQQLMAGRMKGIQGHYNSCYLDSTIFSLFTFSSVLDGILHKPGGHDEKIQQILREDIVNPLRTNGFVNAEKVMKLRKLLGCDTFVSAEKDPEEFINVLLHEVLAVDPLLKIRSGEKIQECNCYQIILDKDDTVKVPTVQFLLERSFLSCDLKFEEIPSCLLVQMPRFGKQFKMFTEIMPSLELDITDLLNNSLRQCFICGVVAEYECAQCLLDPMLSPGAIKQYCYTCNSQVHSHKGRKDHQFRKFPSPINVCVKAPFPRHKMELFAVLCIETSHYVSFVKYGTSKNSWLFFDSMADRIDEENIPEITVCPQIGDYLMISEAMLAYTNLKQLDGFAKRLFCDAYMCMYWSPRMCLY